MRFLFVNLGIGPILHSALKRVNLFLVISAGNKNREDQKQELIQVKHGFHLNSTGCSSAWLERALWEREVAGSNPVTPTHDKKLLFQTHGIRAKYYLDLVITGNLKELPESITND